MVETAESSRDMSSCEEKEVSLISASGCSGGYSGNERNASGELSLNILQNIQNLDKSNIPTKAEEITTDWIRMLVNQYRVQSFRKPLSESEEIESMSVSNCKHNVGDLSSVYCVRIRVPGETVELVAKLLPSDDKSIVEACFTNVFEKEISIYFDLLSSIKCSVNESVAKLIPEAIYASHNVNGAGVLVLKSCVMDGYVLSPFPNGLSVQFLKMAIHALGRFHAYGKKFIENSSINAVLRRYPYLEDDTSFDNPSYGEFLRKVDDEEGTKFNKVYSEAYNENEKEKRNHKFETIIHGEYWEANLMFKEPDEVRILDWKNSRIGSGVWDIAFLIATSVEDEDLLIDDCLRLYRDSYNSVEEVKAFEFDELRKEYHQSALPLVARNVALTLGKQIYHLREVQDLNRLNSFKRRAEKIFP